FVRVAISWTLRFVLVCRRVYIAILNRFVRRDLLRCLAFFGSATDVHGHSLAGFDDLTRARQLKQNGVGFCLIAGPCRANTKLQISLAENLICFEAVLSNDVGNFHFRTAQREINGGGYSEKKNKPDRNHDCDTAEDDGNSGS